jgi:hypothetical protein
MGCKKPFSLITLKGILLLLGFPTAFIIFSWRLYVVGPPHSYPSPASEYVLPMTFLLLIPAGLGFVWAPSTFGKRKIIQSVILLMLLTLHISIFSYFPQYCPEVAWFKDGVLAETMWALPFSGIRAVPLVYQVAEEIISGDTILQVNLVFTPVRDKAPDYELEDVGKILRRFILKQAHAATDFSAEEIGRLRERLQILPEGLEGEVSLGVRVTTIF